MNYKLLLILCLQGFSALCLESIKIDGITLSIVKGDLVKAVYERRGTYHKLYADAIVNAANKELARGSGVCGAIFASAEGDKKELQEYLKKEYPKGIKTGQAVISPSFQLEKFGIQSIIHAVGPIYSHHAPKVAAQLLSDAYSSSLQLADSHKTIHSVAFPFISSGIYGFPKKEAAKIALKTLIDYANNHPTSSLTDVYIVLNNEADYALFTESLRSLCS